MTADGPDEPRGPVVFRDETGNLIFIGGGPTPQGHAPITWKPGENGSRFVVDLTVDTVAVTHIISKRRPRRRGLIG